MKYKVKVKWWGDENRDPELLEEFEAPNDVEAILNRLEHSRDLRGCCWPYYKIMAEDGWLCLSMLETRGSTTMPRDRIIQILAQDREAGRLIFGEADREFHLMCRIGTGYQHKVSSDPDTLS